MVAAIVNPTPVDVLQSRPAMTPPWNWHLGWGQKSLEIENMNHQTLKSWMCINEYQWISHVMSSTSSPHSNWEKTKTTVHKKMARKRGLLIPSFHVHRNRTCFIAHMIWWDNMTWYVTVIEWYNMMNYDIIWYYMIWYGITWDHMILSEMTWDNMILYEMTWDDMI